MGLKRIQKLFGKCCFSPTHAKAASLVFKLEGGGGIFRKSSLRKVLLIKKAYFTPIPLYNLFWDQILLFWTKLKRNKKPP